MAGTPGGEGEPILFRGIPFAAPPRPNGPGLPDRPHFDTRARRHVLFDSRGVTQDAKLRESICSLLEEL